MLPKFPIKVELGGRCVEDKPRISLVQRMLKKHKQSELIRMALDALAEKVSKNGRPRK